MSQIFEGLQVGDPGLAEAEVSQDVLATAVYALIAHARAPMR
jgi:hypothetical protein